MTGTMRDTVVLTGRSLRHIRRSPDTILTTVITPIGMLLLFVYVLGGSIRVGDAVPGAGPGSGRYVDYLLPGILVVTIASGVAYTAFRLFTDVTGGIFERFRTLPVSRSAILWSHVLTSLVANLVSLAVVTGVGLVIGYRPHAGPAGWLAAVGLLALLTLALTWWAVVPGLTATSVDGVSAYSYPLIFLPFISSAFVPTGGMPAPVRWFANHQPVTPVVNTLRALLAGRAAGGAAVTAIAWCGALLVAAWVAAAITYRRRFR